MGCCFNKSKGKKRRSVRELNEEKNITQLERAPTNENNENFKQIKPVIEPETHDIELSPSIDILKYSSGISPSLPEIEKLGNIFKNHIFFSHFSSEQLKSIFSEIKHLTFPRNLKIVCESTKPEYLFFVVKGEIEVIYKSKPSVVVSNNVSFGSYSVICQKKYVFSARTVTDSEVWAIDWNANAAKVSAECKRRLQKKLKMLERVQIFKGLSDIQKECFFSYCLVECFEAEDKVIQEDEDVNSVYFIGKGKVSRESKSNRELLKENDCFGEECFSETKESCSLYTLTKTVLFKVNREALPLVFGENYKKLFYQNKLKCFLRRSELLSKLTPSQQNKVLGYMKIVNIEKESQLCSLKSIKRPSLCFILSGAIYSSATRLTDSDSLPDDFFSKKPSASLKDFKITPNTDLGIISLPQIEKSLGPFPKLLLQNKILKFLQKSEVFETLNQSSLESLSKHMTLKSFTKNEKILNQGDHGKYFFLISKGKVHIHLNSKKIRSLSKYSYFGDRSLITNSPVSATVISKKVTCFVISKSNFLKHTQKPDLQKFMYRYRILDPSPSLESLVPIKLLGRGSFGTVTLCEDSISKNIFALKSVNKQNIYQFDVSLNILREKKILSQVNHPFIVQLCKTLKDESRVYFLMEYIEGVTLFDMLKKNPLLDLTEAKFYMSCLVLVLDYMHRKNIKFRDLKPENIMIGRDGYPKLIDFGLSKICKERTSSVVGTPHYIAPEILNGEEYGFEADYWSLGVILFEMLFGHFPFAKDFNDPMEIYRCVQYQNLKIPGNVKSLTKSFIEKLLSRDPVERGEIKKHSFFADVDFVRILNKEAEAPLKIDRMIRQDFEVCDKGQDLGSFLEMFEVKSEYGMSVSELKKGEWLLNF